MAKLTLKLLAFAFVFALLTIQPAISADPPEFSPSPSPENGADVDAVAETVPPSSSDRSPSPSSSPSPSYSPISSPPGPPAADLAPETSPAPSPGGKSRKSLYPTASPSPAPMIATGVSHESNADLEAAEEESSEGIEGGQKAGIAVGVIAGACVVGLGAVVYKKRQHNIRRAQYGYAARREFL